MQAFLQKYKAGTDFQGIFYQNDDMGIGALEALEGGGHKTGRSQDRVCGWHSRWLPGYGRRMVPG